MTTSANIGGTVGPIGGLLRRKSVYGVDEFKPSKKRKKKKKKGVYELVLYKGVILIESAKIVQGDRNA